MIGFESDIAKKYAQAFLNVFGPQLSREDFDNVCAAALFFKQNQELLFFLSWPIIEKNTKIKALNQALEAFKLHAPFNKLIDLLASQKRTYLIMLVLDKLCILFKERNNIMTFTISSSHQLDTRELEILKRFLANLTGQDIIYDYMVDKDLIAGIRMRSDTLLWEYSISKQLARMKLLIIH